MSRRFAILDVFTDRPLAGNQLAVVLDSEGLDGERMQAIAAEFNLAETVFVLPSERPAHRAWLRIFSPTRELPFAGHPTVGSAVLLALEDFGQVETPVDAVLMLEEKVGSIRAAIALKNRRQGHAIFDVPSLAKPFAATPDRDAIAAALGLMPQEIGFENHEPSAFTAGLPYVFVPVRDLQVVGRVKPLAHRFEAAFGEGVSVYIYTRETDGSGRHFHARMFWSGMGLVEDPATGSAAAAFAGVVAAFDQLPSGTHRFWIEQGFEMGRPSLIALEVDIEHGVLHASRIGGDAIVVARGTLEV